MDAGKEPRKRLRKFIVSVVVILAAAAVVISVNRIPGREVASPEPEIIPVNVEVQVIETVASMPDLLLLPGSLEPFRVVSVPVEEDGRVEEILGVEGQMVEAEDVILRLDTALLLAELQRAKAQADFDSRTLARSLELLERGVFNKSQIEEAEAKAIVSKAVLEVAETNLDRATVKAPSGGVLNKLPVEVGEWVSKGSTVAQIVETDRMKVVIQVPERDVHYLRIGATVPLTIDALGGRRLAGQVAYISEIADGATRTTRVEVEVDNARGLLRSGMIVRTEIARRQLRNVIMVPLSSIIPLEDGRIVYVVVGDRTEQRSIELGLIKGSQAQVLNGLQAGEALVVAGHRQVGPGQLVNVVDSK